MAKTPNPDRMERLKRRQALGRQSFRYTRFLPLRYILAIFCFSNVYWFAMLFGNTLAWLLPGALVILGFPAVYEQIKLLHVGTLDITNELKYTKMYFTLQLLVNSVLLAVTLTGLGFSTLYAFLVDDVTPRMLAAGIVTLGILLLLFCLRRISKIFTNTDKHYRNIVEMEKITAKNNMATKAEN